MKMKSYNVRVVFPQESDMKRDVWMMSVPVSIDIPKWSTEEEHVASVERELALYRTHGVEPVSVHRNKHYGMDGSLHESTQIFFGERPPIAVPRDFHEEVRWAEDAVAAAQMDLREARKRLKSARARLAS